MITGHGGNIYNHAQKLGCKPFEIIDMSSNVNPLGPPSGLTEYLKENIDSITALPEVDAKDIKNKFAHRYDIDSECVISGNGTTQFIYAIPQVLGTRKALILGPTYSDYADACIMQNVYFDYFIAKESLLFQPDIGSLKNEIKEYDTVFICNPNNPTGTLISSKEIIILCRSFPDTNFIIDESYLPFVENGEKKSMISSGLSNVIILNSMSKIFRIPGLRVGFLIASKSIINKFNKYMLPWSVNSMAQAAVSFLMTQKIEIDSFVEQTREFVKNEREKLTKTLESTGQIKVFPSTTVFILARLPDNLTSDKVCEHFLQNRILVRNCSNFKGLSGKFIRISLKTKDINRIVADKLAILISDLSN